MKFSRDDSNSMYWYFKVYEYFFSRCAVLVEFETMTNAEKLNFINQVAIELTKIYCSVFEFSDEE